MPEDLLGNQMQWSCRREVSAQTSHSSEDHVASGTPAALISPKRNEQRKQTKCGVRCPEMPIRRIWVELEGNKDHLLSQARSDPAKREIHVESLNKCIGDLQKYERRRKTGHCRTYKTNLLNLVENTLDCKRSCFERKELSTQIRSKHEMRKNGWCAGTTSWRVLDAKNSEKITRLFNSSLSNCNMQEQTNSMKSSGEFQDIESNYSGRLSHVSGQPEMIPNSRALLSRDKRLPLDIRNQSKVQGTVLGNHFLTFDSLRDFTQRISSGDVQKKREAALGDLKVKTNLRSEDGQNHGAFPMPMFASRPLSTNSKHLVDIPQNYVVGQQRRQMSELQFDKFPSSIIISVWKTRLKNTGLKCFWFSVRSYAMHQRNINGWFFGWAETFTVSQGIFPSFEMLDAKIASSVNKIMQNSHFKKVIFLEQKAPKRTSLSDGDKSLSSTTTFQWLVHMIQDWLLWFILCYSSWWQRSWIRYKMGRSSTLNVKDSFR